LILTQGKEKRPASKKKKGCEEHQTGGGYTHASAEKSAAVLTRKVKEDGMSA